MDKPTNVRPGDRAIIVSSLRPENVGIVVDVLREYLGEKTFARGAGIYVCTDGQPAWFVESLGRKIVKQGTKTGTLFPEQVSVMSDSCLRPLRDSDSEDEMVSRVGRAPVSTLNTKPREHA